MTVNIDVGKNFILSCDGTGTSVIARVTTQSGENQGQERFYTFAHYPKFTQALSRVLEEEIAISDATNISNLRGQLLDIEKRILDAGEKFICKGLCCCESGTPFKKQMDNVPQPEPTVKKEGQTITKVIIEDKVPHRLPKSNIKPTIKRRTPKETLSTAKLTTDRRKEISKPTRKR